MARSGRLRSATTFPAGRRIVAPSRCSTARRAVEPSAGRGAQWTRLEIDRCRAYGPRETKTIRKPPVTSSFRLSFVAAFAGCLRLRRRLRRSSISSTANRPARRHSGWRGRSGRRRRACCARQPARGRTSPGLRPDRGIGERAASARGAVAEVPPGRRIPVRRSLRRRAAGFGCRRSAPGPGSAGRRSKASKVGRI